MELQNAKGTRDFSPEEKIIRDEIVETIKSVFEMYGFNPIETPILERYDTLAAKFAAGEGSDALKETFKLKDQGNRDLGLRFDFTVPFCRFAGMNPNMKMPFKRYQLGDVFRDGPLKKGRYRQFMQMDTDLVGTKSVLADAEMLSLAATVFDKLGFAVRIELNNRKILNSIMELASIPEEKRFDVIISIDKLAKIGADGVKKELEGKGYKKEQIEKLIGCFKKEKDNRETLANIKKILDNDGVKEIEDMLDYLEQFDVVVDFNPSLARGLAYYTGPIYEAYLKDSPITSSVAGGGRYDEMIPAYLNTKKEFPATGISFGVDVIIDAVKERRKFTKRSLVQCYVIPIKTIKESIKIVQQLRKAGIKADFDLSGKGISKNLDFANAYKIPFVMFVGEEELKQKKVKLKNMESGEEALVSVEDAVKKIKSS